MISGKTVVFFRLITKHGLKHSRLTVGCHNQLPVNNQRNLCNSVRRFVVDLDSRQLIFRLCFVIRRPKSILPLFMQLFLYIYASYIKKTKYIKYIFNSPNDGFVYSHNILIIVF